MVETHIAQQQYTCRSAVYGIEISYFARFHKGKMVERERRHHHSPLRGGSRIGGSRTAVDVEVAAPVTVKHNVHAGAHKLYVAEGNLAF